MTRKSCEKKLRDLGFLGYGEGNIVLSSQSFPMSALFKGGKVMWFERGKAIHTDSYEEAVNRAMGKTSMSPSTKKKWWTTALFTREGAVVPSPENFSQRYCSERVLLEDLAHGMKNFYGPRGVYAAMAWSGQVTEHEALHVRPPKFTVWENGSVHVHT